MKYKNLKQFQKNSHKSSENKNKEVIMTVHKMRKNTYLRGNLIYHQAGTDTPRQGRKPAQIAPVKYNWKSEKKSNIQPAPTKLSKMWISKIILKNKW